MTALQKIHPFTTAGNGTPMLLLHGLFGGLSNWTPVIENFRSGYRTIVPTLPIHDYHGNAALDYLLGYLEAFVAALQLKDMVIIGNSLGGHLAILYAAKHPENVRTLVLTGSSGLFENTMSGSYPKRGNYDYIRERVAHIFYDPATASPTLIEEVYQITSDNRKCLGIIKMAQSAQRSNVSGILDQVKSPTLLLWGKNDQVTPPAVAEEFHRMISGSVLHWIDHCGHAPMMEQPELFNAITAAFLKQHHTTQC